MNFLEMVFGNSVFTYTNWLPSVASGVIVPKPVDSIEEALEQEEAEWQKTKYDCLQFADNKFYGTTSVKN